MITEQQQRILANLDKQLKQWRRWAKAYKAIMAEYENPEPDAAILRYQLDQLQGLAAALPEHQDSLRLLTEDIRERYRKLALRYDGALRERCHETAFSITGRAPDFVVNRLIDVHLDTNKNQARINGKRVTPLSLDKVMAKIEEESDRLWGRKFDAEAFLQQMATAYREVTDSGSDFVATKNIYDILAAEDKDYKQDMFAADLAQLVESGVLRTKDGLELVLAPTRDQRQAVWIPDLGGDSGRYVGLIRFGEGQSKSKGE